jgi:hypothetical protein
VKKKPVKKKSILKGTEIGDIWVAKPEGGFGKPGKK